MKRALIILAAAFLVAATVGAPAALGASPDPSPVVTFAPVDFLWSASGGQDGMDFPGSIAFDPQGRLWVADTGNGRFALFTSDGDFLESWGSPGNGESQFSLQRSNGDGYGAIAFAPDGSFYVLDVGNHRVQHFDADREFLGAWGGSGTGPGQYDDPNSIAVDADGVVYVLDDARDVVERYDDAGNVLGSFDAHPDTISGINTANSLALDGEGSIYVSVCCDAGNFVEKFDAGGALLATIGGPGSGQGQFVDQPQGLAIDGAGRLFVAGPSASGDKIQVFDTAGAFIGAFGAPGSGAEQIVFPFLLALDGDSNLYVSDLESALDGGLGGSVKKFRLLPPLAPSAADKPGAPEAAASQTG
jgi:sugar lactone lactonase YvrE